ncbi:hypothetical protein ACU3L3_06850 [Priestia endophytica]
MKSAILEINTRKKKVSGRTYLKWVILEIHENNTQYNRNGITWLEKYIQANIESVKGMPLCVEFLDWANEEPHGHGMTEVKDGTPLFEDSVVVGTTENGYIDTIEVNGEQKRVLIGEGYVYNQRYPKFVQWLKSKMFDGDFPETSVEICAVEGESVIKYEDGWKETGRVPAVFDFSGDAILGIDPADPSAVLLELNSKLKEENKVAKTHEETLVELNEKLEAKGSEVNELKAQVKEVNENLEKKTEELNSTVAELKEVNAKVAKKDEEAEKAKKEKEDLEAEVNELKAYKKAVEDKKLESELNSKLSTYTDEEKAVAKEKIETFSKAPSTDAIKEIISEINSDIAQKIISERSKQQSSEVNNSQLEDIYSDVAELNSEETASIEDLY